MATSVLQEFEGSYEISEAARYIKATLTVPKPYIATNRHMIRWIRHGLALPDLADIPGRQLLIAFEDLISMRVIALLRAIGISFSAIYRAERWLRDVTGARRPFAHEIVWTESKNIFMRRDAELIAASLGGQYAIKELFKDYLWPIAGLEFDERRIAAAWRPYPDIVLRPTIQFGASCIIGTRIPTKAIWSMYKGGDTVTFLANSYRMDEIKIKHAIEWEKRLDDGSANSTTA